MSRTAAFEGRTDLSSASISETILDFAEPLLKSTPDRVAVAAVEEALGIAIAVWNAVVLEQAGETGLLERLQLDLTARTPRKVRAEFRTTSRNSRCANEFDSKTTVGSSGAGGSTSSKPESSDWR